VGRGRSLDGELVHRPRATDAHAEAQTVSAAAPRSRPAGSR
jgi:hypothetical protein